MTINDAVKKVNTPPLVISIAGSDPTGGAGVQQDLKVFQTLGVWGCGVITALTVQDTIGVNRVVQVSPDVVEAQLEGIFSKARPVAIKTGMLHDPGVVAAVVRVLARERVKNLVVDPVIRSSSGAQLLSESGVQAMLKELFPLAALITPNIPEAEALSGVTIQGQDGAVDAAMKISAQSGAAVLLKGGHGEGDTVVDLLVDGGEVVEFPHRRIPSMANIHGTGCALSAAVVSFLALGEELKGAVSKAIEFMELGIGSAFSFGSGSGIVNSLAWQERENGRYRVILALEEAWRRLSRARAGRLIPEIQSNLGYSLPGAVSVHDVAAFPGRIVRMKDGVARLACPEFGASSHVARIILTAASFDPMVRSAMNIRFDQSFLQKAGERGLLVSTFSRSEEPREVKEREGSTLVWGVKEAIKQAGRVPDLIYDHGDIGKEPGIRVLGMDPVEVVEKALSLW